VRFQARSQDIGSACSSWLPIRDGNMPVRFGANFSVKEKDGASPAVSAPGFDECLLLRFAGG